jgi:hypothetical protein
MAFYSSLPRADGSVFNNGNPARGANGGSGGGHGHWNFFCENHGVTRLFWLARGRRVNQSLS